MTEKLFMVHLSGSPDPTDLAYYQPVRASRAEVSEDSLSFYNSDGSLSRMNSDFLGVSSEVANQFGPAGSVYLKCPCKHFRDSLRTWP
jgi:hypothetical protein